ncbi:MAG: BolA family protein [Candidatus Puniceispirillales bacterium]
MPRRDRIITILEDRFQPQHLDVRDVSAQHHGHAGWREGGETHFEVEISAEALSGLSRIDAHRAVNEALADELAGGLHALQIQILR